MSIIRCPGCEARYFDWGTPHACSPKFNVVIEEDYDYTLHAANFQEAAEKAVDRYDEDERDLIQSGDEVTAVVTNEAGESKTFTVCGEAVPQYSASEVAQ